METLDTKAEAQGAATVRVVTTNTATLINPHKKEYGNNNSDNSREAREKCRRWQKNISNR